MSSILIIECTSCTCCLVRTENDRLHATVPVAATAGLTAASGLWRADWHSLEAGVTGRHDRQSKVKSWRRTKSIAAFICRVSFTFVLLTSNVEMWMTTNTGLTFVLVLRFCRASLKLYDLRMLPWPLTLNVLAQNRGTAIGRRCPRWRLMIGWDRPFDVVRVRDVRRVTCLAVPCVYGRRLTSSVVWSRRWLAGRSAAATLIPWTTTIIIVMIIVIVIIISSSVNCMFWLIPFAWVIPYFLVTPYKVVTFYACPHSTVLERSKIHSCLQTAIMFWLDSKHTRLLFNKIITEYWS